MFFSDTSLQSPSYPTGASIFFSSSDSGKLKHSHSWSNITPKVLKSHKSSGGGSRGLSSVEESDQWAAEPVETLSSASPKSLKFYKRTRDPKKPEELFSKAKEQHLNSKKTQCQGLKEVVGRSRTNVFPTSPRTFPHASVLQYQQEPLLGLADSATRHTLKGPKSRHGPEVETEEKRTKPGLEQERQAEHYRILYSRHPRQPTTVRNNSGKDSRQSPTNETNPEHRTTSKDAEEFLLTSNGRQRRAGSAVSPRDANVQGDNLFYSKDAGSKTFSSIKGIPDTLQSRKAPLGPGPWKVPSSAKILSEAEAFRDPL